MAQLQTSFSRCIMLALSIVCHSAVAQSVPSWELVEAIGRPTARHEAAFVGLGGKLYLIGGRRINPIDVFDPKTSRWTARAKTPLELHHFQAVPFEDRIYLIGAMTGPYPKEKPLDKVAVYFPATDKFEFTHEIPTARRRGGAGAAAYQGKIYIVGGITNGHIDGFEPWLDEYDPKTGEWRTLPDAPNARDHFQAAIVDGRLYASAGRTTSKATDQVFDLAVAEVDVFDLTTERWMAPDKPIQIPTPRAGNMVTMADGKLVIGGGESSAQRHAHDEVEVFDPKTEKWATWPSLLRGRHGSGFVVQDGYLYTASGCGNRGGSPELDSIERLKLPTTKE